MEFRPCIDIHNGKVKQIVGGSLKDQGDKADVNFVASKDAAYYAQLYAEYGLKGGHVILLNPMSSEFYMSTKSQALLALSAYPGGLQVGGGINPKNAASFLEAGASHVIVTSYVFKDGKFNSDALREMVAAVGKDKLVLDLSCRKKDNDYYIVTDRWQKFTNIKLTADVINKLSEYCSEFLVHAADVEGLQSGIEEDVVKILSESPIPVTYAGGIHSLNDICILKELGKDKVNFTIGSALDIFGGNLSFDEIANLCKK